MRRVVYIAAPYSAPTRDGVLRNVARALALGELAAQNGLAPIVPHAMGILGVHGHPFEDSPGVRERALECGAAVARQGSFRGGSIEEWAVGWAILRDDGTRSDGVQLEIQASWTQSWVEKTWAKWLQYNDRHYLDERAEFFYETLRGLLPPTRPNT